MKIFASDNNSGVHPRIFEAMQKANDGRAEAYGEDEWTAKADASVKRHLGEHARSWFVFLGTAANVLGLKSLLKPWEAVICAGGAHVHTDECGAAEALVGCKLLLAESVNGKVCLDSCRKLLWPRSDVHHVYPRVLSITQSTECGTVYSLEELKEIKKFCLENDLYLHMDGARISNAAAWLGVSLPELMGVSGVDVISFGGTKNGLMFGEMVVFLNPELGHDFPRVRKQNMQLLSKMRFLSAQFIEYLDSGLWLDNATLANSMAILLHDLIKPLEHVKICFPVQSNAVFARLPRKAVDSLLQKYLFYIIDENDDPAYPPGWPMIRLMTSFNTSMEEVEELARAIAESG